MEFWSEALVWEPGSISHTLVAIMLPLSSMWAASSTESQTQSDHEAGSQRKRFFGSLGSTFGSSKVNNSTTGSGSRKSSTIAGLNNIPLTTFSPKKTFMKGGVFASLGSTTTECGSETLNWDENGAYIGGETSDNGTRKKKLGLFRGTARGSRSPAQVGVVRTYSVRSSKGLEGLGRV